MGRQGGRVIAGWGKKWEKGVVESRNTRSTSIAILKSVVSTSRVSHVKAGGDASSPVIRA